MAHHTPGYLGLYNTLKFVRLLPKQDSFCGQVFLRMIFLYSYVKIHPNFGPTLPEDAFIHVTIGFLDDDFKDISLYIFI